MKPLVSTITPCFRMKAYLKRFLDDLPKQTYFENLEIVLDHNEPDEEEITWVKEFQSKYPGRLKHIIVSPVDPIGVSMNRCIKESSGEILTIWNVDDLRTDNSIELQVEQIEKNNADIVYGDYLIVKKFGSVEGKKVDHEKFSEKDFVKSMIFGPFVMFRKNLLEQVGFFDEQLKSGADFDLSIRLAYGGVAKKAIGLLGYYLNEGKGASTRPNSKQPVERTVIEIRYGIYEKIDYDYVAEAKKYLIDSLIIGGERFPVEKFVKNYYEIIKKNKIQKILIGKIVWVIRKILMIKFLKNQIKKYVYQFKKNN